MEEEKRAFADRLIQGMKARGWKPRPSVLAHEFNLRSGGKTMTLHGVRRWLRGETIPHQARLVILARMLGVDPHVLRYGTTGTAPAAREPGVKWLADLDATDRDLLDAYLRLPLAARHVVREVIRAMVTLHGQTRRWTFRPVPWAREPSAIADGRSGSRTGPR